MRNLPYSTPETKARAQKIWAQSASRSSRGSTGLLLFGLPFLVYVGALFAAPEFVKSSVNPQILRTYSELRNLLEQGLVSANERIREVAFKAQPHVEQTHVAAKVIADTKIEPIIQSLSPTEVVAHQGEDAVFGRKLPLEYSNRSVDINMVLDDFEKRIPSTFDVPDNLRSRVGFWLSVYSIYSSRYHIIHHVDYPWLVFQVIDVTPIAEGPGHKWTRYHRAEAFTEKALKSVREDLRKLSKMKKYDKLTEKQRQYFELLKAIPGKRQNVFAHAATHTRIQMGQKDFFKMGLMRGSKYLPRMEEIFAQYDLPVELTRLPLVESSFNDKAVSKVGASGIWQFMPNIGRQFMKVSETIDERNSPLKATEGAARLLLENIRITRSWPFAITAYNHGPGGVLRASKKLRTNDLAVIIDRYNSDRFGFASSNFYTSFLAALHAERYQNEIFGDLPKYPPHETEDIRLARSFRAKELINIVGISFEELKLYNKDLRARSMHSLVLPKGYRLSLPPGRRARLELFKLSERNTPKKRGAMRTQPQPKRIKITFDEESTRGSSPKL